MVRWTRNDLDFVLSASPGPASLNGADFRGVDLSGIKLPGADLAYAHLEDALLIGAELRGAVLFGAKVSGACLRQADLRNANLTAADFTRCDLTGARFDGAQISGTDITGAWADNAAGLLQRGATEHVAEASEVSLDVARPRMFLRLSVGDTVVVEMGPLDSTSRWQTLDPAAGVLNAMGLGGQAPHFRARQAGTAILAFQRIESQVLRRDLGVEVEVEVRPGASM